MLLQEKRRFHWHYGNICAEKSMENKKKCVEKDEWLPNEMKCLENTDRVHS